MRSRKRIRVVTEWWESLDVVEGDGSIIDLLVDLLDVVGDGDFVFSGLGLEGSLSTFIGRNWDLGGFVLGLRTKNKQKKRVGSRTLKSATRALFLMAPWK